MRILLLARQPLVPIEDGLNLRVHHLFRELAGRHEVWMLYLDEAGRGAQGNGEVPFAGVRAMPLERAEGPAKLMHRYSPQVGETVRGFLEQTPVDVVVASTISLVPYANRIGEVPVVVDLVDALSLLVFRDLRRERSPRKKLQLLRLWWWYRRFERRQFRRLGHFVVVSDVDASVVRSRAPHAHVQVIPNGVDAEFFHPGNETELPQEVVFSGVMGFPPNLRAALYFYSEVLPRVRREQPDVRFTVVGKSPPGELTRLAESDDSLTVTGFVPDLRPYLDRAAAYVAPMVSGSGIKNKILEAWAMGKPVVATSVACSGLVMQAGDTALVADGPDAFAKGVVRLLRDPALRRKIGARARENVLEHYTWQQQARALERLLQDVQDRRRAS